MSSHALYTVVAHLFFLLILYFTILLFICYFFFFNDTATTEIYTLSLHDALPISEAYLRVVAMGTSFRERELGQFRAAVYRSEEHTSELQSQFHLVCRLLLEKKKKKKKQNTNNKQIWMR